MQIWLNGILVDKNEAKIKITLPAFRYGQGLFSTTRISNSEPVWIKDHLLRINSSLQYFNFKPINTNKIKNDIKNFIKQTQIHEGYLRIMVWGNQNENDICLMAEKLAITTNIPVKLIMNNFKHHSTDPLTKHKTLNYWKNELAFKFATQKGCYDAILINENNHICETSRCNIFWVKNNTLYTPEISCGLLPGIARQKVIEKAMKQNIKVFEVAANILEVYEADEVFLTNSVRGLIPVKSINKNIYKGMNKITNQLTLF
ncbi:Aminodeoxychorismate lyase [Candidatus Syntrophocurvum alkaliphilum]|uniref:Aminodeoxychorismate lyase n=1 Tax=Candidatus Syntrophocurvum alkaliphilum TaxID=2293317 RepID=A0A6I6DNN3_9FIRM|nr:aminotransferase class IV [Candidatus Syntrophocurvum alkaliphilum]QGU00548.1 Aminodeoxychorismate lyase [Candidatus Syntrophocurvum alkaliphilum]